MYPKAAKTLTFINQLEKEEEYEKRFEKRIG